MSRERAQAVLTAHFGEFGPLDFPYVKMGHIDSLHLFGDTELMIFALYLHNRNRWHHVLDIGANLGLHSILMAKLGWVVRAFEPDFEHFDMLTRNLNKNNCGTVMPTMSAVHTSDGTAHFIRVMNNLTGSHLEGYKNSYGPKQRVLVPTVDCRKLWDWADFAKIDCEGNEAELVSTMTDRTMRNLDCIMEVRNADNAGFIYRHFNAIGVPMWAQKIEWGKVERFEDMPHANRDGSLFVGHRGPWE